MTHTMHSARVTVPISYAKDGGKSGTIPIGPCLIEQVDDRLFDIIWEARGQSCAVLQAEDVKAAQDIGDLIFLD